VHGVQAIWPGVYDADTRDSLISKLAAEEAAEQAAEQAGQAGQDAPGAAADSGAECSAAAFARLFQAAEERFAAEGAEEGPADPADVVEIVDTDGDRIRFVLVGGRVEEWVNGRREIARLARCTVDAAAGRVRDDTGAFTVPPEGRAAALAALATNHAAALSGAFYTLVPIRPCWRGERDSLRTFAGASLRTSLAFNPRPRRLSTPSDAFELHPPIALYGTTLR